MQLQELRVDRAHDLIDELIARVDQQRDLGGAAFNIGGKRPAGRNGEVARARRKEHQPDIVRSAVERGAKRNRLPEAADLDLGGRHVPPSRSRGERRPVAVAEGGSRHGRRR